MKINFTKFYLLSFAMLLTMISGIVKAQWNTNTSVNLLISGSQLSDMQTASTSDGKLWTAFYSQNGGNYDMKAQLFDAAGNKLLGADGVLVSNQPTGSATFVFNVCIDASNNLVIGCQDQRTGTMQAVLYKISQAGTQMWGASGIILGDGLAPKPALLSTGEIAVSWEGNTTLQMQKITTGGALAWGTPISITIGGSNATRGQIAGNSGGKFTMVVQKRSVGISTTLYAQKFNNDGTSAYAPVQLCSETTAGVRYYSLATDADTVYCGYYSSPGSRFNSYLQRINPNGTIPWGINGSNFNTSTSSSDNYQQTTNINMTPGSNYVWSVCTFSNTLQSQNGVYIQKFLKTTGARQLTNQGKIVYGISANMDIQSGELQVVNDNPVFMSYQSDYKMFVTKLDANGDFVWSYHRAEISSTTSGAGSPKGRYGFNTVGNKWLAGTWQEQRSSTELGYIQGISNGGLFGMDVATQGSVPATITDPAGTLQLLATIFPSYANQAVNWSIIPVTGFATINTSGLVTASIDGTVWAKAIAVQDNNIADSILVTISGQVFINPDVVTMPATNINLNVATLNGTVNTHNFVNAMSFEWGLTTAYGNSIAATPGQVQSTTPTAVSANLSGLAPGTIYHYRCVANYSSTITNGQDLTFTTTCLLAGTIGPITGENNVCSNATGVVYSVPSIAGATGYVWTVPAGVTITAGNNTNSITVDFSPGTQTGDITVYATDGTCITENATAFTVTVTNLPAAAGAIVGNQIVCDGDQGIGYTVAAIAGATGYNWTVPTGVVIVSGDNTSSITVNFAAGSSSGVFTVTGTNFCGTGVTSNPLQVDVAPLPGTPGLIAGANQVCAPATDIVYSIAPVTNGFGYVWSLPSGATIVSGANTNQVTVNYAANATSGNITVYATNGNCQGPVSAPLAVVVNPTPATPVITQNDLTLTSSSPSGNQWYRNDVLITGATNQTYEVTENGTYTVIVTLAGCTSAVSNAIEFLHVGLTEPGTSSVQVYPNPTSGEFWLSINTSGSSVYNLEILNSIGSVVYNHSNIEVNGTFKQKFDMSNLPAGMYTITLRSADNMIVKKLIIRK